jgi:hypothetical protein
MAVWFNGLPISGIDSPQQSDGLKYWFNGLPVSPLFSGGLIQTHFRFRSDAGAVDATPTWTAGEDVNV